jgi:hypothetical protein
MVADESWQSDLEFDRSELGRDIPGTAANETQAAFSQGNRIVDVVDYGAELGGPIVRDRLWVWGSYALNEIDLLTIADVSDFTELETANVKFNAQVATSNSATFFAMQSDKVKIGRNAGPTRPQPTTWNQSKFGDDPTTWKLEDTHIFSSNFYLTGMYSIVNGGFQLVPQGGAERGASQLNSQLDANFVWQQSFLLYQTERPQEQFKADGSTFFNTGSLAHELKFGAGYRVAEVSSLTRWPGFGQELNFYQSFGYNYNVIGITRDAFAAYEQVYTSFYAQDTMTVGNLTANLGLRYDLQEGENLARTVLANPVFPNLMPAVAYPGADYGFEWETITPRLGLTYALGEGRKTLLRASYSQFADQLGANPGVFTNPLYGASYSYFYYHDVNGNGRAEPAEVLGSNSLNNALFFSGNVNPTNGSLLISSRVDPNLDPPLTHELLFGVEHALLPEFVIGLNLTFRQIEDIINAEMLVFDGNPYSAANLNNVGRRVRRDDFVLQANETVRLPSGDVVLPVYGLRSGVASRGGLDYYNSGIEQEYTGVSATFNKRLANRWMLRGNFSWQDWTWDVPAGELIDPMQALGAAADGDQVVQGSGTGSGAKGNVFINSNWSYSVNGLYQIAPDRPWGFNVAANLTGREGYPNLYFRRRGRAGLPGLTSFQVTDAEDIRNPDIHVVDLRVEKEFTFSEVGLTIGADLFNALNESYVLQRRGQSNLANTGNVQEILSPRIFRIGARLSFR